MFFLSDRTRSTSHQESGHLLRVLATFSSSTSGFGLDKKVDKEKARKQSSEGNRHVGAKLNFKRNRCSWHGLNDRVHGHSGSCNGSHWQCTSCDLHYIGHFWRAENTSNKKTRSEQIFRLSKESLRSEEYQRRGATERQRKALAAP
jgi:hypothetical protein